MTPAEVRAIVERVVVEHGCGWEVEFQGPKKLLRIAVGPRGETAGVMVDRYGPGWPWRVHPEIGHSISETCCARAVALWPEMQRLCSMLREALR